MRAFENTFVKEDRWKLFVSGIQTTLLISVLSVLFGTTLGFALFLLTQGDHPWVDTLLKACTWLVQGMPTVVLLMFLYYVVFGRVSIGGVVVSVVAFTLTFGSSVLGLFRMGVGTIDPGQWEASLALGHSARQTLFRVILPQAIPHVLPAFEKEVTGLLKATSIVGYIAVQDLTKMSDIVRSRTYEAFFPLIAITIIYFLLELAIMFVVGRLRDAIDQRRRRSSRLMRGVRTDD